MEGKMVSFGWYRSVKNWAYYNIFHDIYKVDPKKSQFNLWNIMFDFNEDGEVTSQKVPEFGVIGRIFMIDQDSYEIGQAYTYRFIN
jgi:hypothetical protein